MAAVAFEQAIVGCEQYYFNNVGTSLLLSLFLFFSIFAHDLYSPQYPAQEKQLRTLNR